MFVCSVLFRSPIGPIKSRKTFPRHGCTSTGLLTPAQLVQPLRTCYGSNEGAVGSAEQGRDTVAGPLVLLHQRDDHRGGQSVPFRIVLAMLYALCACIPLVSRTGLDVGWLGRHLVKN